MLLINTDIELLGIVKYRDYFCRMMFPTYATPKKIFILDDTKTSVECSHFMVFLQEYKVDVGFRVHRSSQKINGKRVVDYTFERYGWSSDMLRWRSKRFTKLASYLENFFRYSDKNKIDNFLFKNQYVIVEKSYRWSEGIPASLFRSSFTR